MTATVEQPRQQTSHKARERAPHAFFFAWCVITYAVPFPGMSSPGFDHLARAIGGPA